MTPAQWARVFDAGQAAIPANGATPAKVMIMTLGAMSRECAKISQETSSVPPPVAGKEWIPVGPHKTSDHYHGNPLDCPGPHTDMPEIDPAAAPLDENGNDVKRMADFWAKHNHSEITPCVKGLCPGYGHVDDAQMPPTIPLSE